MAEPHKEVNEISGETGAAEVTPVFYTVPRTVNRLKKLICILPKMKKLYVNDLSNT